MPTTPTTSQPRPRPLAGLSKTELRALCATHYRCAAAREAQGKDFILRAKAGVKTAPRAMHDEWRKAEGFKPKFTSARTPGHADPLTHKRWSDK
jgi:hypothetical protein